MKKLSIRDCDVKGKRVLVRVDFNVPLDNDRSITDDTRILESLPTIRDVVDRGGRLILMSHLGRPRAGREPDLSLAPVATRLAELVRNPLRFADDCVGEDVRQKVAGMRDGDILLLENLRFHPEEEKNDPKFAKELSSLGDCYVNDAFGTAHRAHASTEGVTRFLKPAVAGFLMKNELDYLGTALAQAQRPFVAVLGGAKISGKIDVITALLAKVDRLLVGGAMMFTFLKAQGKPVGRSLVEDDRLETAREVLAEAARRKVELVLPVDCVASTAPDGTAPSSPRRIEQLGADEMGVDIGPETLATFTAKLRDAKTVVWNGPMGIF